MRIFLYYSYTRLARQIRPAADRRRPSVYRRCRFVVIKRQKKNTDFRYFADDVPRDEIRRRIFTNKTRIIRVVNTSQRVAVYIRV